MARGSKTTTVEDVPDDRLTALEERIADDPDDTQTWLVYADLLQRRNDPRGELISLFVAAAAERRANPKKPGPAERAAMKLFAAHVDRLFGPLRAHVRDVKQLDGRPFAWRHGFIHRAELGFELDDPVLVLGELIRHPSGRLLSELAVRVSTPSRARPLLDLLRDHPPARLNELDVYARARLGELVPILHGLPHLRRLHVTARSFELEDLGDTLIDLERASFLALGFSPDCLGAIANAPWPKLVRLDLRIGSRYQPTAAFEDLAPLFRRTDLPALTHLKVRGCAFAGGVLRAVADSPLAPRLEVLDLTHGSITPQDVAFVAARKSAFGALRELWLPSKAAWNDGLARLAGIAKHVLTDAKTPIDSLDSNLGDDTIVLGSEPKG